MTTELPGFSKTQTEPHAVINKRIKEHLPGVETLIKQAIKCTEQTQN